MLPGKWKDWEILDEIGSGSYGTVYQIEKDDIEKAVKIIEIPKKEEMYILLNDHSMDAEAYCRSIAQDFETEIKTLKELQDCPNIVHIEDYLVEKRPDVGWNIYIFMDCLTSFPEYSLTHALEEEEMISFALEMTNALMACEERGIIHRDIKPENILITEDGHFQLCDFGLARELGYKQKVLSVKGTYKYMAPEVYHGKPYHASVDIYSLGLILYQYMNHRRDVFIPLEKEYITFQDEEKALGCRMGNEHPAPPVDASEEFADIILRMIAYHPEDRYDSPKKLYHDLLLLQKKQYRKKRNLKKYRLPFVLFLLLVMSVNGYVVWSNSYEIKNEKCGDAAYCSLNRKGELIIKGKGEIDTEPWYDIRNHIKKVIIEKGITGIAESFLFNECDQLESVSFPQGFTYLGDDAFSSCPQLDNIQFPQSLDYVGCNAFQDSKWREEQKDDYTVIEGILICSNVEYGETLVLPENVEMVSGGSFEPNNTVKKLVLPDSLSYISFGAFEDFEGLQEIQLSPNSNLSYVGSTAFSGTPWIKKDWTVLNHILIECREKKKRITIPDEVKQISNEAFSSNHTIKECLLPSSVFYICPDAFLNCSSLEKIEIKGPVEEIESGTFANCSNLKEIILPDTLKIIHEDAFTQCENLEKITMPEGVIVEDKTIQIIRQ